DDDDRRGNPDLRVSRGIDLGIRPPERHPKKTMPQKENYRVGLVQMSCSPDPEANLEKAADRVREAARDGAQIVCLPELFRTQYFCQREDAALFDLAEPIPGPSTARL